jgi:phosphatidylinositol alpha-mannosyltransferase
VKIGIVFDDSLDKVDGVAQYVLIAGEWLAAQGHDVHYLVGSTKRTDLPKLYSLSRNMRVRFNKNRMSMPLPANKNRIRQLLHREQFDVLHIQMPYSPALAGRIIAAAGGSSAIVGTFHILPHSGLVHFATRMLGRAQRASLRRFDAVMSTSPPAAAFAKKTFKIDSTVVPLGIPLRRFFEAEPFAKYNDKRTIVTVGRLVARKGCQYLLAAIVNLKSRGLLASDVRVVVCGSGPLERKLKQYVRKYDIDNQVSFEGQISEADKPRYLACADIAVYPSTGGESFGIVLLEAMAAARGAVLGGNNRGYASVLGSHAEALFEPKAHNELADKLYGLLEDAKARREARRWQRLYVRQFDINNVGKQIEDVYRQALRKRLQ